MTAGRARRVAFVALLCATLALISCSGSNAPEPGTPAFYWGAAKETFAAGDYANTIENLDKLTASDNEYTARAQPWLLVLSSGMARGYAELADSFEAGARMNKTDTTSFRRQVSQFRGTANRMSLHFAETFAAFQQKNKDDNVSLAFSYPTGSAAPVALLGRVSGGFQPPPAEMETAQKRAIERGVLLSACRAAGAPDDTARTQELFKTPDVKVARPVFLAAMAHALFEESQIYSRQKLDDPDKFKIFCSRAQEVLKTLPASKDTKELNTKIEAALKSAKLS